MLFVFLRNQAIRRLGPSLPLFQKARMCNPPHSYIPSLTKSVSYTLKYCLSAFLKGHSRLQRMLFYF